MAGGHWCYGPRAEKEPYLRPEADVRRKAAEGRMSVAGSPGVAARMDPWVTPTEDGRPSELDPGVGSSGGSEGPKMAEGSDRARPNFVQEQDPGPKSTARPQVGG